MALEFGTFSPDISREHPDEPFHLMEESQEQPNGDIHEATTRPRTAMDSIPNLRRGMRWAKAHVSTGSSVSVRPPAGINRLPL